MLQCVIPEISHYCIRQYDWIRGYASSPRSMFPIILCKAEWLLSQNSRGFESYNLGKQWISCSPFFPNHLLLSLSKRHTSVSYILTYIIILPPSSIFDCSINTYIFFPFSSLFFLFNGLLVLDQFPWINFFFVKKIIQWNPVNTVTNGPKKNWQYWQGGHIYDDFFFFTRKCMAVIMRWLYYWGCRKAWFHCLR